jgi:type IX secretion system PorP/SprF family membrane protein
MITKKIFITFVIIVIISQIYILKAQYHIAQTQFARNEILLNPAYASSKDYYTFAVNVREQWTGIEGAPSTQSFYAFGPIRNKNIGIGLSIINDKVGVSNQLIFNLSYAYKLYLRNSRLSMGFNVGSKSFSTEFQKLTLDSEIDQKFNIPSDKYLIPYLGAGAYYEKENYSIGLSIPVFLNNTMKNGNVVLPTENRVFFFLSGAYLSKLSNDMVFKTGMLIKGANQSNLQFDLIGTLFINDEWNVGVSYRSLSSASVSVEYGFNKTWYFTYSYDFATSCMLYNQSGTHEFTLTYILDRNKKSYYVNPRYF